MDPGARLREMIPAAQVVGCVVHLSSIAPAPGVVQPVNGSGLIIGRPAGGQDPGLLGLANVLLTPHMASATLDTRKAMSDLVMANLQAWSTGAVLLSPVPTGKNNR